MSSESPDSCSCDCGISPGLVAAASIASTLIVCSILAALLFYWKQRNQQQRSSAVANTTSANSNIRSKIVRPEQLESLPNDTASRSRLVSNPEAPPTANDVNGTTVSIQDKQWKEDSNEATDGAVTNVHRGQSRSTPVLRSGESLGSLRDTILTETMLESTSDFNSPVDPTLSGPSEDDGDSIFGLTSPVLSNSSTLKGEVGDPRWSQSVKSDRTNSDVSQHHLPVTRQSSGKSPVSIVEVELTRPPGGSLGISIVGGQGSKFGDLGIYVKEVIRGGPAAKQTKLKAGDEIVSVNSIPLKGMTHKQTLSTLRGIEGVLVLGVIPNSMSKRERVKSVKSVKPRPRSFEGRALCRTSSETGQRTSHDEPCHNSRAAAENTAENTAKQRSSQHGMRPSVTFTPSSPNLEPEAHLPSARLQKHMTCSMESFGSDIIDLQFEPRFEKSPEFNGFHPSELEQVPSSGRRIPHERPITRPRSAVPANILNEELRRQLGPSPLVYPPSATPPTNRRHNRRGSDEKNNGLTRRAMSVQARMSAEKDQFTNRSEKRASADVIHSQSYQVDQNAYSTDSSQYQSAPSSYHPGYSQNSEKRGKYASRAHRAYGEASRGRYQDSTGGGSHGDHADLDAQYRLDQTVAKFLKSTLSGTSRPPDDT